MRYEKAKEYFEENLSLGLDSSTECLITGDSMDYYLSLYNGSFKFNGGTLISLMEGEGLDNEVIHRGREVCDSCHRKDDCFVFKFSLDNVRCVCERCLFYLGEVYSRVSDEIINHVDDSGFVVVSSRNEVKIYDSVDCEYSMMNDFVVIGSEDKKDVSTHISNIRRLVDGLESPENCDFVDCVENGINSCAACSFHVYNGGVSVGNSSICEFCLDDLICSLREYIEENECEIVSKSI